MHRLILTIINTPLQRGETTRRRLPNRFSGFLLFSALFLAPLATANSQTQPATFQSSENQTSLLELYTSEGCSSCPPAEAWLSGLKNSPRLWQDFVPIAFHVDYWDYLGWRDPWSSKEFSDRQRTYARAWRGGSVYTPGFVLNGKEWRDWSRPKDGPRSSSARAGILKISSSDLKNWHVSFAPASREHGEYELHAALLANALTSDVKAGENRGRRLNHDFAAVGLVHKPLVKRGADAEGEFTMPRQQNEKPSQLALAVWITRLGDLEPLQATGGFLTGR